MPSSDPVAGSLVEIASGAGFASWQRERPPGTFRLHWSPRGAVRMHVVGRGAGEFARLIIERYEEALRTAGTVLPIFDLEKMQNYDTQLRTELTDWCVAHRGSISAMHVYAESSVVMMGVRVANLLLRGLLTVHDKRDTFDSAVREAGLGPVAPG